MMVHDDIVDVGQLPAGAEQISVSSSSSPPMKNRGSNPPTCRKAERRTIEAPARKPTSAGPGSKAAT